MENDPDPDLCYDNFTDEDFAALEAQAEAEDRAAGKGALYDERDVLPDPPHGEPPPLPELTDDEKARSLYGVPFPEAFGKERIEILLNCQTCGAPNTIGMWEFAVGSARTAAATKARSNN
jgi:hypothetical protein